MSELDPGGQAAATWYVRRAGKVRGPYPAGIISSYLILGRIAFGDEVSLDGEHWLPVESVRELVPELLRDGGGDPGHLMAARRWHDERRHRDRRRRSSSPGKDERRHSTERRQVQPVAARRRHVPPEDIGLSDRRRSLHERRFGTIAALSILTVVGLMLIYRAAHPPVREVAARDCDAPPSRGIDWSHCEKSGITLEGMDLSTSRLIGIAMSGARLMGVRLVDSDLSYADLQGADLRSADLSGARLVGVNLRDSDLRGSRLQGANLLYADLRGALVDDGAFLDAELGQAIWLDGRLCAAGSRGTCRLLQDGEPGERP